MHHPMHISLVQLLVNLDRPLVKDRILARRQIKKFGAPGFEFKYIKLLPAAARPVSVKPCAPSCLVSLQVVVAMLVGNRRKRLDSAL